MHFGLQITHTHIHTQTVRPTIFDSFTIGRKQKKNSLDGKLETKSHLELGIIKTEFVLMERNHRKSIHTYI